MNELDISALELIIRSELPGLPPSVNHYLCRRGKNTFKTHEAREWQTTTATILMLENRHQPAYEGDVYVEVQYYTRKLRSWDIDNRLKILQDCLALSGIIKDDRQIMRTTTEKLWTNGGEYTVIEVRKLPEGMYARPALKAKRERPCVAKA